MTMRSRIALVLLVICGTGALAYLVRGRAEHPVTQRLAVPNAQQVVPPEVEPGARSNDAPAPAPPVRCAGQRVRVVIGGDEQDACFGETRTVQNGSVRLYEVEAMQGAQYSLRIEALGSAVLSAALRGGASLRFRCEKGDCRGIVIGRHDVEGVRTIALNNAALSEVRADGSPSPRAVATLTGELRTVPEDRLPALACAGQGVSVVTSDGSASTFCPNGGAGFEIGADGHRRYRFTNLDGASILIGVDDDHHARRVEYEGEEVLVCAAACRVRVSRYSAAGERTFTFEGTTLLEATMGQRNAVLNGTLIVPSL